LLLVLDVELLLPLFVRSARVLCEVVIHAHRLVENLCCFRWTLPVSDDAGAQVVNPVHVRLHIAAEGGVSSG
jgi:hypothetical protein